MRFVLDVGILLFTFVLMWVFRRRIAGYLTARLKMSGHKLALLVTIPLIIVEECINSNDHGLVISVIIMIILLLEAAVLYWVIKRFRIKSGTKPILCFAALGTLWELTVGGLVAVFSYPWFFIVFMVLFYVPISYAYIVLLPVEILRVRPPPVPHEGEGLSQERTE